MTKNSARSVYLLIVLVVVLLDRWTKHAVAQRIALYSHIQIIPGFFRLTHTENTGAAFSLFADSPAPWKTALLIAFSDKRYQWPVFNLADSAIVVGAGLLVLEILFHKSGAHQDPAQN